MEDWMAQLQQAGPEAAWDLFLDRYRRLIFAAIRHYAQDYDDVMDVFARVCEALRGTISGSCAPTRHSPTTAPAAPPGSSPSCAISRSIGSVTGTAAATFPSSPSSGHHCAVASSSTSSSTTTATSRRTR